MKNALTFLGAMLLCVNSTMGQGQVVLATLSGVVNAPITDSLTGKGPGPDARAQLYLADSNTPISPVTTFLDAPGFEQYLNQVTVTIPGNTGQPVNVQLRAWIAGPGGGATYETASSRGQSAVISVTPTLAPATPTDLVGLQGFSFAVPEPPKAQIVLGNLSDSVDAPIGFVLQNGRINPGPDARAQLYFADSNSPIAPATTFLDEPGFEKYLNQVTLTIPGNAGQTVNVKMVAWMLTGPGGAATYEQAIHRGQSAVFSVTPSLAPEVPADLIGLTSFDIIGFVPEPSAIALSVLGLGMFHWFRRRGGAEWTRWT